MGSGQAGLAATVDWACGEIFTEHAEPICGCSSVMGGSWLCGCVCVCVCACVVASEGSSSGLCVFVSPNNPRMRAKLRLKLTQTLSSCRAKPSLLLSSLPHPPALQLEELSPWAPWMNKWRFREQQSGPSLAVSDTVDDVQSQPHTPMLA